MQAQRRAALLKELTCKTWRTRTAVTASQDKTIQRIKSQISGIGATRRGRQASGKELLDATPVTFHEGVSSSSGRRQPGDTNLAMETRKRTMQRHRVARHRVTERKLSERAHRTLAAEKEMPDAATAVSSSIWRSPSSIQRWTSDLNLAIRTRIEYISALQAGRPPYVKIENAKNAPPAKALEPREAVIAKQRAVAMAAVRIRSRERPAAPLSTRGANDVVGFGVEDELIVCCGLACLTH
jgi:hypothetical protein